MTRIFYLPCPRCEKGELAVAYVPSTRGSLVYIDDLTASCKCWTPEEVTGLLHPEDTDPTAFVEALEVLVAQWEALRTMCPAVAR